MDTMGERLRWAREKAGIPSARQAANKLKLPVSTYAAHENGQNEFGAAEAHQYGRAFGVSPGWLLTGEEAPPRARGGRRHAAAVPLVGYVGAGAQAHFTAAGELGEAAGPDNLTESTVAVEIRGESLGAFFDRWIVFYDDVRRPVTSDLIGRLCVVGLADGRVLIKKIQRSRARGLFHLLSQTEAPILDAEVEWAAPVKTMAPR